MNTQKRITVSACALFIMLGFVASGLSELRNFNDTKEDISISEEAIETSRASEATENEGFIIKLDNGYIAVFSKLNDEKPLYTTEIHEGVLRNLDKESLTSGIFAEDPAALAALLEDFGS